VYIVEGPLGYESYTSVSEELPAHMYASVLRKEAVCLSKKQINTYQTTQHHKT
jgi:hypothetical protein